MDERYYTVKEIAARLGLKETTIRRYIREKKLRAYRFGDEYRVAAQDVADFLRIRATMQQNTPERVAC
jgi:excisionase family DNA binding protein